MNKAVRELQLLMMDSFALKGRRHQAVCLRSAYLHRYSKTKIHKEKPDTGRAYLYIKREIRKNFT